jgi:hypothetical protein
LISREISDIIFIEKDKEMGVIVQGCEILEQYEYTPLYYETPCQVRFLIEKDKYIGGIAMHDYVICGCCGHVFPIEDIMEFAKEVGVHWEQAIIELEWWPIHHQILGD